MWWSHGDWGWGAWLVMSLGMVGVWAALIWAVLVMVRAGTGGVSPPESTAEDILARRLARGEIDEAEYCRRLDALHGRPTTSATHRESTP